MKNFGDIQDAQCNDKKKKIKDCKSFVRSDLMKEKPRTEQETK
jgi:hypothetical protein